MDHKRIIHIRIQNCLSVLSSFSDFDPRVKDAIDMEDWASAAFYLGAMSCSACPDEREAFLETITALMIELEEIQSE